MPDYSPIPVDLFRDPRLRRATLEQLGWAVLVVGRCSPRGRFAADPTELAHELRCDHADILRALQWLALRRFIRIYLGEERGVGVAVGEVIGYNDFTGLPDNRRFPAKVRTAHEPHSDEVDGSSPEALRDFFALEDDELRVLFGVTSSGLPADCQPTAKRLPEPCSGEQELGRTELEYREREQRERTTRAREPEGAPEAPPPGAAEEPLENNGLAPSVPEGHWSRAPGAAPVISSALAPAEGWPAGCEVPGERYLAVQWAAVANDPTSNPVDRASVVWMANRHPRSFPEAAASLARLAATKPACMTRSPLKWLRKRCEEPVKEGPAAGPGARVQPDARDANGLPVDVRQWTESDHARAGALANSRVEGQF